MKTVLSLLFVVFSLIGIADAGYITYEEITGREVQCGSGFDCGTVLDSPYAHIGPVPLSALGLVFYSSFFTLGILNFLDFDLHKISMLKGKLEWPRLFLILGGAGFIFSLYLIFLMAVVIDAWCKFCLISAGTTTLLFITSVLYYLSQPTVVQAEN